MDRRVRRRLTACRAGTGASDEGPSRWWYVGMFVLVLSLFALLTVLYRA